MLNALTVKSKSPIPVIDELLDELSSARWFSCLDLRTGFNQICLAPGEEHKTAFQTHWGHFEFTIMVFGLTGAPNTFQGAMNTTLKPLLRKCVIVFLMISWSIALLGRNICSICLKSFRCYPRISGKSN